MHNLRSSRFTGGILNVVMFLCLTSCGKKETSSLVGDAASSSTVTPTSKPRTDANDESRAIQLTKEAAILIQDYQPEKAKEKMLEAQRLIPEQEGLKNALIMLDKRISQRVAGRWFSERLQDATTGQETVSMTLAATEKIRGPHGPSLSRISVSCRNGKFEILLDASSSVDSDLRGNGQSEYRFDDEEIHTLKFTRSPDKQILIFLAPDQWIDRLIQHSDGHFLIELPLTGDTPRTATFALAGADRALSQVKEACDKKK